MNDEEMEKQVSRRSASIYIPIALCTALVFLLAASMFGSYPVVAKIGGTVWVGLLSLIVSMPIVTARVKQYMRGS